MQSFLKRIRTTKPRLPTKNLGLNQYLPELVKHDRGLVFIFVHGWSGSSSSWRNIYDKFFEDFHNCSVHFFNYGSGLRRLAWDASENIVADAQVFADDMRQLHNQTEIVVIAHSQGGLVTNLAIKNLFDRNDLNSLHKIRCVIFYNTPFRGLGLGTLLNKVSLFRADSEFLPTNNSKLHELERYFERNFDLSEVHTYSDRHHLPAYGVISTGDFVVSNPSSGSIIPEYNTKTIFGTHSSEIKSGYGKSYDWVVSKIQLHVSKPNDKAKRFNLDTDAGVAELVAYVEGLHESHDYETYYICLAKYSSALKRKARHAELADICRKDLGRHSARNIHPIITYSQCQLVQNNTLKAFETLKAVLVRDPSVKKHSPHVRLLFIRTYAEVLLACGNPELSKKLMEGVLQDTKRISAVRFRIVSHAFGVLARAYDACELNEAASEIFLENLMEQELTSDDYAVAIASMNYGRSLHRLGEYQAATKHFSFAKNVFRDRDVRALHWANLNLLITKLEIKDSIDCVKIEEVLEFHASTNQSSNEYLEDIKVLREVIHCEETNVLIDDEIVRCETIAESQRLQENDLEYAERSVNSICAKTPLHGANPLSRRVSIGGYKARSTLLKSFKKSLDQAGEEYYLKKVSSDSDFSRNPFLNDVLVTLCKNNPYLIQKFVLDNLNSIALKSDSVLIFYSQFLESEDYDVEAIQLLDGVSEKSNHMYLTTRANVLSKRLKNLDDALDTYESAIDCADIEHRKAVVYNNMAHAIHRHRRRDRFNEAIEYCQQSIKYRTGIKFFYPSALMLALKVEQSTFLTIDSFLIEEIADLGLRGRSLKHMQEKIIDLDKRQYVAKKVEEYLVA